MEKIKYLAFLFVVVSLSARADNSGQVIATQTCVACHGTSGEGNSITGFPELAGLPAAYLKTQMNGFLEGKRQFPPMLAILKTLKPEELEAVAAYYAGLPRTPSQAQKMSTTDKSLAQEIIFNGYWKKNVPSCIACHGSQTQGHGEFPPLAGQNSKYLQTQLQNFKMKKRDGGPDQVMSHIAQQLSAHQIRVISKYLSSLPSNGPFLASEQKKIAPTIADAQTGFFQPPLLKDLPSGENGDSIQRGYLIFSQTPRYAGDFVGGHISCVHCHINLGRQPYSAPMWAAWGLYPKYRKKNNRINDMAMRLQGCFTYSENAAQSKIGHAPEAQSKILIDLQSYIHWLAEKAPTGVKLKGQGFKLLKESALQPSAERGAQVYSKHCEVCHGADGQGQMLQNEVMFPPLWGKFSYNSGAGMHNIKKAAAFIKHNMPFGNPGQLSDQEAWDVATYINAQERPEDPRKK